MPVIVIDGLPRSGKSYHAMETEVVKAAKSGRRILCSIDGVNPTAISLVVGREVDYVQVTDEQWRDPDSYPYFDDRTQEIIPGTLVEPGDLIVMDEFHAVWKASDRVSDQLHPRIEQFFRRHGKYVSKETRKSIRIVLITHSPSDVHPFIRAIVDATTNTIAARNLGMATRYRYITYSRDQHVISAKIDGPKYGKYRPEIYNLYQSFSGEAGVVEGTVSKRFRNAMILVLLGFLLAGGLGYYGLHSSSASKPSSKPPERNLTVLGVEPSKDAPKASESSSNPLTTPPTAAADNRPMVTESGQAVTTVAPPPQLPPSEQLTLNGQPPQQQPQQTQQPQVQSNGYQDTQRPRVYGRIDLPRFRPMEEYGEKNKSHGTYIDPSYNPR